MCLNIIKFYRKCFYGLPKEKKLAMALYTDIAFLVQID